MKLYHGTTKKFDKFDFAFVGLENGTAEGKGFYFSDTIGIASVYGRNGYLYTVELETGREITEHTKMTRNEFKALLMALDKEVEYLSNYGEVAFEGLETVLNRAIESEFKYSDNDVDILGSLANGCGSLEMVNRTAYEVLGITHIRNNQTVWGNQIKEHHGVYVALIPELIKIEKIEKI